MSFLDITQLILQVPKLSFTEAASLLKEEIDGNNFRVFCTSWAQMWGLKTIVQAFRKSPLRFLSSSTSLLLKGLLYSTTALMRKLKIV